MTYSEYWDYLCKILEDMEGYGWLHDSILFKQVFKLTASPYHYWLENRALTHPPQEKRAGPRARGSSETYGDGFPPGFDPSDDPHIFADNASKLRSKLKTAIKAYHTDGVRSIPLEALGELNALVAREAPGKTIYAGIDAVSDIDLVNWNSKHGVFL